MGIEEITERIQVLWEEHVPLSYGCVLYIFDSTLEEGKGVCICKNADFGDALIAIEAIIKLFGLNKEALAKMLLEGKLG